MAFAPFETHDELPVGPAGCSVTVTTMAPPLVPPLDNSLVGKSSVKDGALHGYILAASDRMVALGFPWKALLRWGYRPGEPLVFTFAGVERVGHGRRSDSATEVAESLANSIPAYRKLKARLDKVIEARADVKWGSPQEEALKAEARAIKNQLQSVPLPAPLRPGLPLTFDNYPHCELRGVEIVALEPIFGESLFLDVAAGAEVVVRKVSKVK